jgi:hypothetical protein
MERVLGVALREHHVGGELYDLDAWNKFYELATTMSNDRVYDAAALNPPGPSTQRPLSGFDEKRCSKCKQVKSRETDFCRDRRNADNAHKTCKACQRDYTRQYVKAKRETILELPLELREGPDTWDTWHE